jgi:hypothetical protein
MRTSPHDVRFEDAKKVCEHCFGAPRQTATSHCVFKTPWLGDPRVNIQRGKDCMAKAYQVKQILAVIDRLAAQAKDDTDES